MHVYQIMVNCVVPLMVLVGNATDNIIMLFSFLGLIEVLREIIFFMISYLAVL